jgi:hypothetical protein
MLAQAAIALAGFFMRRKKCDLNLLTLQDVGDQRGHAHVARVKGQINGFLACGRDNGKAAHPKGAGQ